VINEVLLKMKEIHLCHRWQSDLPFSTTLSIQHSITLDAKQVIGLTNEVPISTEYRPLKSIIEKINRTFKGNYRSTYGF